MSKFSGLRLCGIACATGVMTLSACLLAAPASGWAQSADPSRGATRGAQSSNDGQNRRVRIHNQTGWTIVSLYATDTGRLRLCGARRVLERRETRTGRCKRLPHRGLLFHPLIPVAEAIVTGRPGTQGAGLLPETQETARCD